jgi:hypothetical protein
MCQAYSDAVSVSTAIIAGWDVPRGYAFREGFMSERRIKVPKSLDMPTEAAVVLEAVDLLSVLISYCSRIRIWIIRQNLR